jgi:hypothetical protein
MKIVELKINDSILAGIDAVALVESPAIEENFITFNKVNMAEMTYNDYPQGAVDAARRGIELNEKNNNKCATQVGKVRAQQLVNGENLSLDTIQRMRSFLIRQKGNYELATRRKDYNACGYISYLLWGGEAALPWAEKKLRGAGIEFAKFEQVVNNEGMLETYSEEELIEEIIKDTLNINVFGYETEYFYMCPAAKALFEHLVSIEMSDFAKGMVRAAAVIADNIFDIEEDAIEDGKASVDDLYQSAVLASDFKDIIAEIDKITGMPHDTSFIDNHVEIIRELVEGEEFEINVAALPNYINEASTGGRKKELFAALKEKQMLMGPLMTPSKLIPRKDEETGEEYKVYFTKETIEKIAYKMMEDKLLDSVNIEHDGARRVDDVYLVETWIVKDPTSDKSLSYGFKPVEGQWFGIYKVKDGRVWNEYVKTGKVKGFSVEGYFINNILTNK